MDCEISNQNVQISFYLISDRKEYIKEKLKLSDKILTVAKFKINQKIFKLQLIWELSTVEIQRQF